MPNQTKPTQTPYTSDRTEATSKETRSAPKVRQTRLASGSAEPLQAFPRTAEGEPLVAKPIAQPYNANGQRPATTERSQRLTAQPYQQPRQQDYRVQMRRFVDDSPTAWFHLLAHRVALVIQPFFAATTFLVNVVLQMIWGVLGVIAPLLPDDSQRRIKRMQGPMLHQDSPAAMIVFAALFLFGIGFATKPFLLPETVDPRSFDYTNRPAWQRIADPSRALNWLSNAVSNIAKPSTPELTTSVSQPLAKRAPGDHNIQGAPTISPEQIDKILESYGSPAAGTGQAWYDLGVKYNIDPAYAVAFFIHESSAGTNPAWAGWKDYGSRTSTHNVGNIICAGYATCYGRFRDYSSWEAGIDDWYRLIAVEYIQGRGTLTIDQIIPIYAPSFENDVDAYVNSVEGLVDTWRSQGVQ